PSFSLSLCRHWLPAAALPRVDVTIVTAFSEAAGTIVSDESMSKPCVVFPLAIHEFPEDIFTKEQRKRGAVLLHVLCAVYMFYALAIVCDKYFVPSLEKISENLQLSEDVAGATFMAAGSSAPELFTSLIGVFITKGDVGVGTIVGSAVFNILVIIGVCGIFTGQVDMSVCLSKVLMIDEVWESMLLISMYGVYILIMNRSGFLDLFSAPAGSGQESPVVMVDELLILRPHQLSFPEAGLRVMITPHFSPRTRLTMAGRMLISERQRLLREDKMSRTSVKTFSSRGIVNGGSVEAQQTPEDTETTDGKKGVKVEVENSQPEKEDEDRDEMFKPLHFPVGYCARLKWLVSWPLAVLLYYTVPNCVLPRWHHWFMITFIASTFWIAIFSYLMVWMVTIISYTLGIPDYIMGITFLAAGTSVPDCMASLIVARQGMGDMAVSNSIGSNIFDILLGLGFPWALRTLVVDHGSSVFINNKGLVYSVILLLASVFLTIRRGRVQRYLGPGSLEFREWVASGREGAMMGLRLKSWWCGLRGLLSQCYLGATGSS
uniref:Sodium/calcium exchanger membrane region domain-containing protein n=1 Tax=Cyprinus carpio TaxID=7962 RepID=A0A8C1R799_CYPCA